MEYQEFLERKNTLVVPTGLEKVPQLNKSLFPFQDDITKWALKRGRAAIFADCGMGKTIMQLEWAKHIPGKVLILAPLAVSKQSVLEGDKFGIKLSYCRKQSDIKDKITITNYEMLDHFDPDEFTGIVLDESSIIKSYEGKFRNQIIDSFNKTPFRLACTATPAPNDYMELGNHSEFLGIMTRTEMLSMFFVHDGGETQKWRLKGHAEEDYWKWLASWAVMIRKPSDLGYKDGDFVLPKLNIQEIHVEAKDNGEFLVPLPASTLQERLQARRGSIVDRVSKCAEMVNADEEQWIVWCNLNSESEALTKAIDGAVEIKGSNDPDVKAQRMVDFTDGKIRVLVTKPSIAGFGMNWQHCKNIAFVGLSDSYEEFYQAIRRCWRFGQKNEVDCHIIISTNEGNVLSNIKRKEEDSIRMAGEMVKHMKEITKENIKGSHREEVIYKKDSAKTENFEMVMGDCIDVLKERESDSVHYSIFSPPFSSLYTYSNSQRDMGNSKNTDEFLNHFQFLVKELYRVLMPGRLLSFHCMNLPTSKTNHGYIGIFDFRGQLIKSFQEEGFIYHSEVCIWKDPVTAMQRTKALGLLHKQIKKDSCMSRQGIADYLVTMRKPGENPERVTHTNESFPVQIWQHYASPVWMDINPSDTLQFRSAREHKDERHICPLQLEVIDRAVKLWTNPDDTILSPFAGIGSEGYVALKNGRKFLGVELKESYFRQAVGNLKAAEQEKKSEFLFDEKVMVGA
jgi:DNA modification methylase